LHDSTCNKPLAKPKKTWYTIRWPKIRKKPPEGRKNKAMLDIVLPGTGGTTPRADRHLSCAYLRYNGNGILVDCGEGTQIAVKKAGFSIGKIGMILLTHFHADHCSGLPGLLLTMGNEGRREKVKIYGPKGVGEIVKALTIIAPELPFSIECIPLSDFDSFSWQGVDVTAFEVHHTGTCFGYDFRVRRGGKFDKEKAEKNNVPMKFWRALQNGQAVEDNGVTYTPDMVLGESRRGLHVTYATDTRPCDIISTMAYDADLMVLEGMFGVMSKENRAKETCHMTIPEAARLAREAEAKKLWLTHFSPSEPTPHEYENDARKIFPETEIADDGMMMTLRFPEDA